MGGDADWVAQMGQVVVAWNLGGEGDSTVRLRVQAEAVECPRVAAPTREHRVARWEVAEESSGPQQPPPGAAQTVVSFCLSTRWFARKQAASVVCAWSPSRELYQECPHIPEPTRQLTADQQGTSLHLLLNSSAPIRVPLPHPSSMLLSDQVPEPSHLARFESVAPKTPSSRLDAWDAARLLATLGIVWTHVCDAQDLNMRIGSLGRYGTSYYILAAALFTVRAYQHAAGRKFFDDASRKAKRLLLPYVVWSAIYATYYFAQSFETGETLPTLVMWWGPFAGTALHLWFLPFIFVWGLWGTWAVPRLVKVPTWLLWIGGLIVCAGVYWLAYTQVFFWVDRPWLWTYHLHRLDRWIDEAPLYIAAIILGTAFYKLSPRVKRALLKHPTSIAFVSVSVFLIGEVLYFEHAHFIREQTGTDGRFVANVIGLSLLTGSAALGNTRFIRALAPWGRFTYVAFLVHVLVLELLRDPMKQLPGYGTVPVATLCSLAIFAASVALSMLIARSRFLRWLRP